MIWNETLFSNAFINILEESCQHLWKRNVDSFWTLSSFVHNLELISSGRYQKLHTFKSYTQRQLLTTHEMSVCVGLPFLHWMAKIFYIFVWVFFNILSFHRVGCVGDFLWQKKWVVAKHVVDLQNEFQHKISRELIHCQKSPIINQFYMF